MDGDQDSVDSVVSYKMEFRNHITLAFQFGRRVCVGVFPIGKLVGQHTFVRSHGRTQTPSEKCGRFDSLTGGGIGVHCSGHKKNEQEAGTIYFH
jgi:hypothetical protein